MAHSFDARQIIDGSRRPLGYAQETALSSAKSLSDIGTIPAGAAMAVIECETQDVRYRDDGTNPTASVGMILAAKTLLTYTGDLTKIKFIETAASAKLNVSYYA